MNLSLIYVWLQANGAFHEEYASADIVHRGGYDGESRAEAWEVGLCAAPALHSSVPVAGGCLPDAISG